LPAEALKNLEASKAAAEAASALPMKLLRVVLFSSIVFCEFNFTPTFDESEQISRPG
jgi:hypothetical protein